jgi:hypothetical protein
LSENKLNQLETEILELDKQMTKLKEQYAIEYAKQHPDPFGIIMGEAQVEYLTKTQWEKEYLKNQI